MLHLLAFGPAAAISDRLIDSPPICRVQELSRESIALIDEWKRRGHYEAGLKLKLQHVLAECEQRTDKFYSSNILSMYKKLCELEIKHQLVSLHQSLVALQRCDNLAHLPELAAAVVECAPDVLPPGSRLFQLLNETTLEFANKILQQFQADFEDHLRESDDLSHGQRMWCSFISDAKGPITSYVLMSILPVALSVVGSVGEAYENSLDAALAPMWSRLHFHLMTARDEETLRQLVWSFQYAMNFVDTLVLLAIDVMTDASVTKLLMRSGHVADVRFILKKVSRFMRAHVATFIDNLSELPGDAISQIVECALEFDSALKQKGLDSPFVSEVFCDYKPALEMWLLSDRKFMVDRLRNICPLSRDDTVAYSFRFKRLYTSHVTVPGPSNQHINCFTCVYEVCWLLLHICQTRYSFIPWQCVDRVVDQIVEPALCAGLGFLLYRIRSQPALIAISKRRLPEGVHFQIDKAISEPVFAVLDSAKYFLEAIRVLLSNEYFSSLKCNLIRFEQKWKILRSHLSASSMLSSGNSTLNSAASIITLIYSTDIAGRESNTDGLRGGQESKLGSTSALVQVDLCDKTLADILHHAEKQALLICQGLFEEFEDMVTAHNLMLA